MKKSSLLGRSYQPSSIPKKQFQDFKLQNQKIQSPNPSLYYEAGGAERGDNTEK